MQALVLEKKGDLSIRDIEIDEKLGADDVKIKIHTVGICGSDVHYFQHGSIGPFVVREPMVLGHEASGTVTDIGSNVKNLKPGNRVCMEPGVPDPNSKPARLGIYNLDPAVKFWATPPIHGCLRESVVHPAAFTYKLPDNVSFAEGAMVEPLAIGMHAAGKARITPGDIAVVTGAGTIGMVTALAAIAGGCAQVIISDVQQEKLDLAATLGPVKTVNVTKENLKNVVDEETNGWGADIVFECSGVEKVASGVFEILAPAGTAVLVGMPANPIEYDVIAAQIKEATVEHIFRYAHVYPRAIALMASGQIDVKPLLTDKFNFTDSLKAYEFACNMPPSSVKAYIEMA